MGRLLACFSLLLTMVAATRADVAPYPAWRLLTNGTIQGAAQEGGAIYLGGSFTKLGRGVAPFDGFLELGSLALAADPGCARNRGQVIGTAADGASRLVGRDQSPFGSRLSDGAGPFVVGDDVQYVRVGSDCRFDRAFALRLPVQGALRGSPVYVGDRLYSAVVTAPAFPGTWYVAAFDARTGDLLHGWPAPPSTSLVGMSAHDRLALTYPASRALTLGFVDVTTGVVSVAGLLPGAEFATVTPLGSRALISWSIVENQQSAMALDLYDLATWQRLPAWPEVRAGSSVVLTAMSAARVVVAATGLRVGGAAGRALAAFDLGSGAPDTSWTAPAWLDDPASLVWHIATSGARLVVGGDFAPGAPRDTIAALDLATGALDAWEFPYAVPRAVRAGSWLSLGNVTSARRVARRYMAAVDAATGDVLPWDPGALLPASDWSLATAFSQDGSFAYAAHLGTVRRYDLGSGVRDASWRLDVLTAAGLPAWVSRLAMGSGEIYATGSFDRARAGGIDPFEARNGGAAISLSGALTSWNPRMSSTCITGGRIPSSYPCIADLAVTPDRVFLRGWLNHLDAPGQVRFLAAVTREEGVLDATVPNVSTQGLTSAEDVLWANVFLDGRSRLARVDPGLRATVLPESLANACSQLAARNGRVYACAELDAATGASTGNPTYWLHPLPSERGILNIEYSQTLALHPDLTAVSPGRPSDLVASVSGDRVVLRWTRAPTDLQPMTPAPPDGGTAATSHLVTASVTAGGAPIVQLDTASAETTHTVTAPSGVFYVRVMAKNAFGFSEPSNEVRVEVRPSAPDPPVAAVATVVGQEVRVRWQAAPTGWPADGYRLEVGTRPGASDIAAVGVSGIGFTAVNVPAGRYYVRVRGVNANGAGGPGQEMVVDVGS